MSRELMFENDRVICWKTTITPNNPLKMHRRDRARCYVGLTGGTLKKHLDDGTVSDMTFETGKAYWADADPPDELHADINEGDSAIVVMVMELKNEAERDGTKDSRADCGSGKPGEDSLGKPPSDTPVGWEPPTAKRAA